MENNMPKKKYNKNSPTVRTFNLSDMNRKLDPFTLKKPKAVGSKRMSMEQAYGKKSKY